MKGAFLVSDDFLNQYWSIEICGGNGWITDMADRIIVRSSTAYRDYSRLPNGLSSLILPWLRFQSFSRSSTTQQVKRVISV